MTLELVRRLSQSGLIAEGALEAALLDAVRQRRPLLRVLGEASPESLALAEGELGGSSDEALHAVRAAAELMQRLPHGLCNQLLAVPIRRDPRTGMVDVAAVDPLDAHTSAELSFHLRAPVRALRAPFAEIASALELSGDAPPQRVEHFSDRTPAFGTPVTRSVRAPAPSERPRRATLTPASPSEPPIPLVRRAPPRSSPMSAPPPEPESSSAERAGLQMAADALEAATSAEAVVGALVDGLRAVSDQCVVFGVRGNAYEARATSVPLDDPARLRELRVAAADVSVLRTAVEAGYYLGPLPDAPSHVALASLLGKQEHSDLDELYATPVLVDGRAALIVVACGFEGAYAASRLVDELCRAAGVALERVVLRRKLRT